ncbi:MAG: protein translocase subunit SecD [Bifidobacteriaceae bacterium]|nr:protein translocase subunit SecD [Bifidobacteriaceae bacterium]
MASKQQKTRPGRTLAVLVILIAALFGTIGIGVAQGKTEFLPKFALDLEGGTEMVLTPVSTDNSSITSSQIDQAIDIIRSRVNASGVTEAEVSNQGTQNIVVAIPGNPSTEDLALVTKSAKMTFRTVLQETYATVQSPTDWMDRAYPNPTASPTPASTNLPERIPTVSVTPSATATAEATESGEDSTEIGPETGNLPVPPDEAYTTRLTNALDADTLVTDAVTTKLSDLNCAMAGAARQLEQSNPDDVLVTCSEDGTAKYVLGPVMLEGSELTRASSGMQVNSQGNTTGVWEVAIEFNGAGAKQFAAVTTELYARCQADSTDPTRQFAIVLDDLVISAPQVCEGIITGGTASITGSFTQKSSSTLAQQLSFGSLPINFQVESQDHVSATAGSDQLQAGLWAGLIGLILVFLYSLFQYRALAVVTMLSLVFATGFSYGMLVLLGWLQNYRLSLAGVAGIIVSIGITADSFIVYFERIKDELRVGRPLSQAVDLAWVRARRTIIASDGVNFLAAIVLYFVAVGGVRGFAFTLGLTTVMDLVVVILFTHPIIQFLTKLRFWRDGHPWSGLDPFRLGAPGAIHYAGRLTTLRAPEAPAKVPAAVGAKTASAADDGAAAAAPLAAPAKKPKVRTDGLSIAERKRLAAEAASAEATPAEDAPAQAPEDAAAQGDSTEDDAKGGEA